VTRQRPKLRAEGRPDGEAVVTLPTKDPLNPIEFNGGSVIWPAGAPPPVLSKERMARLRGRLREHTLDSDILGERRSLSVYSVRGADEPACLLIALDGEDYTGLIPTPAILDELVAAGRLPPTVAVFVNHQGLQFRDLAQRRDAAATCICLRAGRGGTGGLSGCGRRRGKQAAGVSADTLDSAIALFP
jgi:enterochelin esterase-like enzyme